MRISTTPLLPRLAAILTGVAVPALVLGRAVMAVPLAAAMLLLVALPERRGYGRAVLEQARTPVGILVIVTLVLWLPNIVQSPFPGRSFEAWARLPVFIGLVVMIWAMLVGNAEARTVAFKALLVSAAVSVLFAVSALTFLPEILSFARLAGWTAIPYEGFRPHDLLKAFASMGILLVPALIVTGRRLGGRWLVLGTVTAAGLLVVVWLTYNRSAMAGLLAMLVVAGGLVMAVRRDVAVNVAIGGCVIAILAGVTIWLYETRGWIEPPDREGVVAVLPPWLLDYQRQTIWGHAIDFAMQAPWFGNGINTINLLPGADERLPANNLNVIPAHPHNWLVEVFAETGAVGALALVVLVAGICISLGRDFLGHRDGAVFAALMVNVGYWASGLLNFSFWSAWWQVGYLLLTALCLAAREGIAGASAPAPAGPTPAAAP